MLRGISKRKRRSADEIKRHFACTVGNCTKSYGSESALKMHQKIKHDLHDDNGDVNPKLVKFKHLLVTAQKDLASTPVNGGSSQKKKQKNETQTKTQPKPIVVVTPPPVSAVESPPPVSIKTSPPNSPFASPALPSMTTTTPVNPAFELALNIPLVRLQMDLWERSSLYFGDLIARVSLTERKFFWESVNLEGLVRVTLPFDDVERLILENDTLKLIGAKSPSYSVKTLQLGQAVWVDLPPETPLFGKNRTHVLQVHKVTNFVTLCQFLMADQHLRRISILSSEK
eukprot:TRINITY_DN102_c0_g1_i1.p1 TRINITY_DN102_c0_g1~~TRINITY_DN102_c0_g1_i1.p1  ORF type:complete len:285 (+),score=55.92 TRINITY_DN102_c0_g1_i1:306-1160(+)